MELNHGYFTKLLPATQDGFYSIYDGCTEYALGKAQSKPVSHDPAAHPTGFFMYMQSNEAENACIPESSKLFLAPRVVLKCRVWGDAVAYKNGSFAFSNIQPIQVMNPRTGYRNFGGTARNSRKAVQERSPLEEVKHAANSQRLRSSQRSRKTATERLLEDVLDMENRKESMKAIKMMEIGANDLAGVRLNGHEAAVELKRIHRRGGPWNYQIGHNTRTDQTHERGILVDKMIRKGQHHAETVAEAPSTWGY